MTSVIKLFYLIPLLFFIACSTSKADKTSDSEKTSHSKKEKEPDVPKKTVAFLQGHGELSGNQIIEAENALKESYHVQNIDILSKGSESIEVLKVLDSVDLLIIAKPEKPFTEKEVLVLDQYLMNGGKIIWSIDMINDARDSLYSPLGMTYGLTYPGFNNVSRLFFENGIRIKNNLLFVNQDKAAPAHLPYQIKNNEIIYRVTDWGYYPLAAGESHPISANLTNIKLEYTSSIDITNKHKDQLKITPLIQLDPKTISRMYPIPIRPELKYRAPKVGYKTFPVAMLIEGVFTSVYKNRLQMDPKQYGVQFKFRDESLANKMIVIADGDIFKNDIDSISKPGQHIPIPLNESVYSRTNPKVQITYSNQDFLMNSVAYLLKED